MNTAVEQSWQRVQLKLLAPLRRQLGSFWAWWSAQLEPLVPAPVRALLDERGQRLVIELEGDAVMVSRSSSRAAGIAVLETVPLESCDADVLAAAAETVLVLPPDRVLVRSMTLPLAAEENLREVLSFEMDRQTPFSAAQVYYDCVVKTRDSARRSLSLDLVAAPRKTVDAALERLTELGVEVDGVTTRRALGGRPLPINLLPSRPRARTGTATLRMNSALGALAGLLLVIAIALPLAQKRARLSALELELLEARAAAASTTALRREVERLDEGSGYLVAKKETGLKVLKTLDEVSRLLPDHTWVSRMEINAQSIQLQGLSSAAALLIPLLEESPLLENVRFQSTVVRAPSTGEERFHITADLEARQAP